MQASTNFYFDSVNQTIMGSWSMGRVVLVGDAGYSVSLSLGQSTSVAMVGAYVLTGELATHPEDLPLAFSNYESELRAYVENNQQLAHATGREPQRPLGTPSEDEVAINSDELPDFGQSVMSLTLRNYQ